MFSAINLLKYIYTKYTNILLMYKLKLDWSTVSATGNIFSYRPLPPLLPHCCQTIQTLSNPLAMPAQYNSLCVVAANVSLSDLESVSSSWRFDFMAEVWQRCTAAKTEKQRLLTLTPTDAHTHTHTDIHLQLRRLGVGLASFIFPVSVSPSTCRPPLIFLGAYIFPGRFLW